MQNQIAIRDQANEALSPLLKTDESKAMQLAAVFRPMTEAFQALGDEMVEIQKQYEKGYTPELGAKAKQLRLKLVKIRTSTEEVKKAQKADIILMGKAIDGLNNIVKSATTRDEETLRFIEEHELRLKAEELEKLQEKRVLLIAPYVENAIELKLAEMDEDVFESYLSVKKNKFEAVQKEAQEIERLRIEKEKKEAEEREAQRLENIRLKKEAEEREKKAEAERKKAAEDRAKEKAKADAILKKEQEAKAAAEAKLKAIEEEKIAKAKKEAEEAEKLAKAGDKKKVESLSSSFAFILSKIDDLKFNNKAIAEFAKVKINEAQKHLQNETK